MLGMEDNKRTPDFFRYMLFYEFKSKSCFLFGLQVSVPDIDNPVCFFRRETNRVSEMVISCDQDRFFRNR